MADDRMKHDDQQRNMGSKDREEFGKQTPGRSGQGGQQGGQQAGQQGSQKESRNLDDDEDIDTGSSNKGGGQNRGGQNR